MRVRNDNKRKGKDEGLDGRESTNAGSADRLIHIAGRKPRQALHTTDTHYTHVTHNAAHPRAKEKRARQETQPEISGKTINSGAVIHTY